MTTVRLTRHSLVLLLAIVATGCGLLSRKPNSFYSLDTLPSTQGAVTITGTPIGIDGIELPPGIDRREIATRGAEQKLEMRGTHQWASPLEEMVLHTLAFDLANRLPEGMVVLPGQLKPAGAMRSLSVVFEDLAAGPENVFVLDARWTLATAGNASVTRHERIEVPVSSMEGGQIAPAMSQALATLADRMAAQLGTSR